MEGKDVSLRRGEGELTRRERESGRKEMMMVGRERGKGRKEGELDFGNRTGALPPKRHFFKGRNKTEVFDIEALTQLSKTFRTSSEREPRSSPTPPLVHLASPPPLYNPRNLPPSLPNQLSPDHPPASQKSSCRQKGHPHRVLNAQRKPKRKCCINRTSNSNPC